MVIGNSIIEDKMELRIMLMVALLLRIIYKEKNGLLNSMEINNYILEVNGLMLPLMLTVVNISIILIMIGY